MPVYFDGVRFVVVVYPPSRAVDDAAEPVAPRGVDDAPERQPTSAGRSVASCGSSSGTPLPSGRTSDSID